MTFNITILQHERLGLSCDDVPLRYYLSTRMSTVGPELVRAMSTNT